LGKELRLEVNEYADETYEEFIGKRGGTNVPKVETASPFTATSVADVAASVDWRSKTGILNTVQNQASCGSCWAFSTTAAVESR